jgi:hypothetical protein
MDNFKIIKVILKKKNPKHHFILFTVQNERRKHAGPEERQIKSNKDI